MLNKKNKYMLFAGWKVRIMKNCDGGLENVARGRRPRAAFSNPRSQFFTIGTDPKPAKHIVSLFTAIPVDKACGYMKKKDDTSLPSRTFKHQ